MDATTENSLETILATNAAVQTVRQAFDGVRDTPDAAWVRGTCPHCEQPLVSNVYYVGSRRWLCVWECWGSLRTTPTCSYRKVL